MAGLSGLKEKLAALQAQLVEKTDKIGFIRKWREKSAQAQASPKPPDPHSLSSIYRDGGTGTRLQVLAFYLFVIVALVSAGSLVKKVVGKMRLSAANEQLKEDYSHQLAEAQRKVVEKAEMVALGQFTTNAFVGPPRGTMMMSLDLWLRVSDPAAATQITNKNEVFRDKTMDALTELFNEKVSLLTEEGKALAREKIREAINKELAPGQVEEVFIQNLVMQ